MTDADLALLSTTWISEQDSVASIVEDARMVCESIRSKREEPNPSGSGRLETKIGQLRTSLRFLGQLV
jgi:hypothetical protein